MRLMYDGITPSSLPSGASMVAGYVNGLYANMSAMASLFPHAIRVGISITASADAGIVLDVETGDATPGQAPGWVQMRRRAGVDPSVYCNTSTWPAVRAAFRSAGVAEPHYWIAQYDGDPAIPAGAVAKQYQNTANYDASSVAAYWPGVDPAPSPTPPHPPQELDMPQWIAGPVVPGADPTVVLPPCGAAWSAYPNRTLHLATDQFHALEATVRVAIHDGHGWLPVKEVTITAAGGRVGVPFPPAVEKISLQTDATGVGYAIETW